MKTFKLLVLFLIVNSPCFSDCLDKRLAYEDAHRAYQKILKKLLPKINAGNKLTKEENKKLAKAQTKELIAKESYQICIKNEEEDQEKMDNYHGGSFDTGGD